MCAVKFSRWTFVWRSYAMCLVPLVSDPASRFANLDSIPPELYEFDRRPEYLALRQGLAKMEETGKNLFFRPHETITRNTAKGFSASIPSASISLFASESPTHLPPNPRVPKAPAEDDH